MPKYADVNEIKKCLFACTMQELQLGHTADARAFRRAAEIVRTWPAAEEVAPVRHAHWVKGQDNEKVFCSACSIPISGEPDKIKKYFKICFNCGAKMDEEVEEENGENEQ